MKYYIGVDVGTSSVRAALVNCAENPISILQTSVEPIKIWNDTPDHFEQSSEDIWSSVIRAVKAVLENSKVSASDIGGIGFDATCSLVVLDSNYKPMSVTAVQSDSSGQVRDPNRNVIMWMDHRALDETEIINSTDHSLLQFVGGTMSAEMEMPKVLWLKKNLKDTWNGIAALMDLPDFLTYRATGSSSRSLCSLVCKWAYDASKGSLDEHSWNDEFLTQIGLEDLIEFQYRKLGFKVCAPGESVGKGLSDAAAEELGLLPGTAVGTSLIDAHAGGIGMLVCSPKSLETQGIKTENKLGLICGTSTCHMIVSEEPVHIDGVWGPYYSAMVPEMWLNEGGQSATGKVIEHVLESHPAYNLLKDESNPYSCLNDIITAISAEKNIPDYQLAKDLHVYPDFHGNRSPLADPTMKGMVSGLTLSNSKQDLAVLYLATLQSLVYGTKYIVEEMEYKGHDINEVYMCGGLIKNLLFVQMTADILDKRVVISDEPESVLIGAALLGFAADEGMSLYDVINVAQCDGTVYEPNQQSQDYHTKKYKVFQKMCTDQLVYRDIMNGNDAFPEE